MNRDDDVFTGSASDGDISSTDLSIEELGAKETGVGDPSPPELGDAPPLLSGYSQTYVVRKQDPQRNRGRNRQVTKCGNLPPKAVVRASVGIILPWSEKGGRSRVANLQQYDRSRVYQVPINCGAAVVKYVRIQFEVKAIITACAYQHQTTHSSPPAKNP